jgi:hypothetical protein
MAVKCFIGLAPGAKTIFYFRLHQERWFRKGFYEMETPGKEGVIGLQVPHSQHFVFLVPYEIS